MFPGIPFLFLFRFRSKCNNGVTSRDDDGQLCVLCWYSLNDRKGKPEYDDCSVGFRSLTELHLSGHGPGTF